MTRTEVRVVPTLRTLSGASSADLQTLSNRVTVLENRTDADGGAGQWGGNNGGSSFTASSSAGGGGNAFTNTSGRRALAVVVVKLTAGTVVAATVDAAWTFAGANRQATIASTAAGVAPTIQVATFPLDPGAQLIMLPPVGNGSSTTMQVYISNF